MHVVIPVWCSSISFKKGTLLKAQWVLSYETQPATTCWLEGFKIRLSLYAGTEYLIYKPMISTIIFDFSSRCRLPCLDRSAFNTLHL